MNKAALLKELSENTYVMLRPSKVEGVGVFAIRDIAKGCREMFSKPNIDDNWILISKNEIEVLPSHSKFLIENYCLYDAENYYVPDHGFKKVDLVLFLNHSDTPNIISLNDGEYFEATRDIQAGEELFLDYGEIVDEE